MASQAQINANRRNALKSTGPRTPEGRAAVRSNALKHGFAARNLLLTAEAQAEIIELARAYCRSYRPDGPRETLRVLQLAIAAWRTSLLRQLEAATLARCSLENGFRPLNTLGRYQSLVEAALYRAIRELEELRASRQYGKEQSQSPVGEITLPARKPRVAPRPPR